MKGRQSALHRPPPRPPSAVQVCSQSASHSATKHLGCAHKTRKNAHARPAKLGTPIHTRRDAPNTQSPHLLEGGTHVCMYAWMHVCMYVCVVLIESFVHSFDGFLRWFLALLRVAVAGGDAVAGMGPVQRRPRAVTPNDGPLLWYGMDAQVTPAVHLTQP